MNTDKEPISSYHESAVKTLEFYDKSPAKSDEILSAQFTLTYKDRLFRRTCQFIFLTLLRNKFLIDALVLPLCAKKPSARMTATLRAAAAEICGSDISKSPKIIHSWVDFVKRKYSKSEAGFLNAVLRKFLDSLQVARTSCDKSPEALSTLYSHPRWLVKRWIAEFGLERTEEILKVNSMPSEVFLRKSPCSQADSLFSKYSQFLEGTNVANFFKLKSGHWEDISDILDSPYFYIQDPSTMHAPKLLSPEPGKTYLDLCAAPGGKSRAIADLILAKFSAQNSGISKSELSSSIVVSVDARGPRMKTLAENLSKIDFLASRQVECDLLAESLTEIFKSEKLPELYDGVLLDAPCSNTGVLRRRPDARYRISPEDISNCSKIQIQMLNMAADTVKIGGRLVYSTCSIENEENAEIVAKFLESRKDFKFEEDRKILPSENSDGSSAFLLIRIS